jgi:hypothetical protein
MEMFGVILIILLVSSVYLGNLGSGKKEILIEVNTFVSYYFNIGIFYNCIYEDAHTSIDQVTIGLFFINFNFVFYKEVA